MSKNRILLLILGLIIVGFYLIWTFFISLNNEVVSAFEIMNERLTESNAKAEGRLDSLYVEVDKTIYSEKAKRLSLLSAELTTYIEELKQHMTSNIKDPSNYEVMSGSAVVDSLFFDPNNGGHSKTGIEFIDNLNNYKTGIRELFKNDFPEIVKKAENDYLSNSQGKDPLEYHFKAFPLVASLTKLTQIQADVSYTEKEILQEILKKSNN